MELSPTVGLMVLARFQLVLYLGAHWEQLCLGGWVVGVSPVAITFTLSSITGTVTGAAERDTNAEVAAECLTALKLIRHATPALLSGECGVLHAVACVCIMCHWKDEQP